MNKPTVKDMRDHMIHHIDMMDYLMEHFSACLRERRNLNVGPCPANWPNGVGMGNGQHVVNCYDLDEDVKVQCLDCGQDFYSE